MRRTLPLWLVLLIAALAALVATRWIGAGSNQPTPTTATHDHGQHGHTHRFTAHGSASFDYRPASASELARKAPLVVQARVTAVTDGAPQVVSAPGEPGGQYTTPTQMITLSTVASLKGKAPASLKLFRIGNSTVYIDEEPPFRVGEQYVLFLRPRQASDGSYLPIAPEGRLRLGADGSLTRIAHTPEGGRTVVVGKTVAEVKTLIAGSGR